MRFRGLDLNLLAVFDGLMQSRSVSATARQMNLSQPAMSAALARLRDYFGDPLLVSHGKRMYPTAFAESLVPQVRASLSGIEALLATSAPFDPATSRRSFRLVTSDYLVAAVIAPMQERLAHEAPGIHLKLSYPDEITGQQLDEGKVDLAINPREFLSQGHPAELLFEERHVVVGWRDNPLLAGDMDEAAFLAAGHVSVAIGARSNPSFADRQMALLGKVRRIEVEAASFATVPWLLVNTQRISVMHERLARCAAEIFPIRIAPLPFAFPVMEEHVQFHHTRAKDEGLIWLKSKLREASSIQAGDGS
ncbi:MAG: LysR family transcriptional regulator [Sphingomonadales bacterium]|nr:LysR family transcriptional regulator [Sphingomonadales bacterium]MDE2171285.1 LysR family transcriptional regulator [Sphingomonadales bacterium]